MALDLTPGAFDRRIDAGTLALETMTMDGNRKLYRREQIRQIILAPQ